MGVLAKIFGEGAGFKDIFLGVWDRVTGNLPPEKKAEMDALLLKNQHELDMKDKEIQEKGLALEAQLNATAGENIRAEANSKWRFVAWARPAVIWTGNVILIWNYILLESVKTVVALQKGTPIALPTFNPPEYFWWVWGGVVGGYIWMRTREKQASMKPGA
jgi:hypothetical protein